MPTTPIAPLVTEPLLSPPRHALPRTARDASPDYVASGATEKRRSIAAAAWARQSLTAVLAASATWTELGKSPHAALFDALERLVGGASRHNLVFAVVALVLAVAVLDIDIAGIAAVSLSILSFSSVVTLAIAGGDPLIPLIALATASGIVWQRRVELCEMSRYLIGRHCERFHIVCPEDDLSQGRPRPLHDCGAFLD